MRVLLITGAYPPMECGVGDYTARLAAVCAQRPGVSVAVLTSTGASGGLSPGFELFPVVREWRIAALPAILGVVRSWRPDVIHMQYPSRAYGREIFPWLLPTFLRVAGHRTIQTWHEYYPSSLGALRNIPNALVAGSVIVVRPRYLEKTPAWHRRLIGRTRFDMVPNASAIPIATLGTAERDALRARIGSRDRALIAYFGFLFPHKGVDLLFDIADPASHHLVIVGRVREGDPYHSAIVARARSEPWVGRVTFAGFQPPEDVAAILSASDAVVLPFRDGGGVWNTSLHAAMLQGTFVLTTSSERYGYDAAENVYRARPDDVEEMRRALRVHLGARAQPGSGVIHATWDAVGDAHLSAYRTLLDAREGQ